MPPPNSQPSLNDTLSLIISGRMPGLDGDSFSAADWDVLARKAHSEGVGPLLYWTLSRSGKFSSLPQETRNFLRLLYASVWMQNQMIFKELEVLVRLFHQAEIPVVALKGVCFALTVYPDIGLRPMGDMDLLVPSSKISKAVRIAKSLDYMDDLPEVYPGLRYLLNQEIGMRKMESPFILLELHNSLLVDKSFTYAVPVEWFWAHTEPLVGLSPMRFENLCMLSPTAQVLYASAHAILKHGKNAPLRWFYDLDCMIRIYFKRMDWDMLLSQAKIFEWGSALDAALSQTHTYFNTPIPDRVLAELSENTDRHNQWVMLKQIRPATRVIEELQNLMVLNWYGRFILIFGLIAPSPAYMRWRYQLKNSWMLPAWYLFRWWGILKDAVRTVIVLLQRGCPANQ